MSEKASVISSSVSSPESRLIHYCYNTPLQISPKVNHHLLSLLTLIISFAYAIENVWITALMISFGTPNIVDSFIWIIPNIIAILLRPYIVRYVNLVQITMNRESRIISICMLASGIGCLLVGLSTQFPLKDHVTIKIFICTVGWTLMDAGMELAQYFIERMGDFIDSNFKTKRQVSVKSIKLAGSISAYLITFGMLTQHSKLSLKVFLSVCRRQYYAMASLAIVSTIVFIFFYDLPPERGSQMRIPIKCAERDNEAATIRLSHFSSIQSFLPGIMQFKYASKMVKLLLLVHFCVEYLADIVLIYATMWLTIKAEANGRSKGASYCIGMRDGSLALAAFTLVSQSMSLSVKSKRVFEGMLLGTMFFTSLNYFWFEVIWIYSITIAMGMCVGFYRNQLQSVWEDNHPVYSTCLQLVQRMEKIFVLCVMPFIIMILMERNDIIDCIGFAIVLMGIAVFAIIKSYQLKEQINCKLTSSKAKFN